ncbi:MAG: glycosyltransferase family 2 protein [Pseudomonadota bacterium]
MSSNAQSSSKLPSVAVIIVNYKAAHLVAANLPALLAELEAFEAGEVMIVDNASPGDDRQVLTGAVAPHDNVRLINAEKNGGFAYGNNVGLSEIGPSDLVFFLNPDARPRPGALAQLATTVLDDPKNGIVGPLLVNEAGEERPSAFGRKNLVREFFGAACIDPKRFGLDGERALPVHRNEVIEAPWISGAAMMTRREVIDQVGGMDEGYFLYFEETDWIESIANAGYRVLCDTHAVIEHIEGQSTGVVDSKTENLGMPTYWYESWRRFWTKNRSRTKAVVAAFTVTFGLIVRNVRWGKRSRGPKVGDFAKHCLWPILKGA